MAGYGTDEGFATYASDRGYTEFETGVSEARLRGSEYLDGAYSDRWPGTPTGGLEQERAWPRTGAQDAYGNTISGIPTRVIHASYEAALLELTTPGSLSALTKANERTKRAKAGPVEVEYFENKDIAAGAIPVSSRIEGLLQPILGVTLPAILVV